MMMKNPKIFEEQLNEMDAEYFFQRFGELNLDQMKALRNVLERNKNAYSEFIEKTENRRATLSHIIRHFDIFPDNIITAALRNSEANVYMFLQDNEESCEKLLNLLPEKEYQGKFIEGLKYFHAGMRHPFIQTLKNKSFPNKEAWLKTLPQHAPEPRQITGTEVILSVDWL